MALVHYCWNQLISLLAASAETLGKALCALRHLPLRGGSRCPSAGTVSNLHSDPWDFAASTFWSPSLLCQGSVDAPDCPLPGPEAGSPVTSCPGPPGRGCRSHSFFPVGDLHVCLVAGLQHWGICICECVFFSAPDPTASSAKNCFASHAAQARLVRLRSSPGARCRFGISSSSWPWLLRSIPTHLTPELFVKNKMGNIKAYISSCNSQSKWESYNKFTVIKRRAVLYKLSLRSKIVYYQRLILGGSCCWVFLCWVF